MPTLQNLSPQDTALTLHAALYGLAPANAQFNESVLKVASATGAGGVAAGMAAGLQALSSLQFANQVIGNLGIQEGVVNTASVVGLTQALAVVFENNPLEARGQITLNLSRILSGLTEDGTFGAAARAWQSFKQAAYDYSSNTASQLPTTAAELARSVVYQAKIQPGPAAAPGSSLPALGFSVVLDKPVFGEALSVRYSTVDGGASAGTASALDDYVPTRGTLTFLPGQTQAVVTVQLRTGLTAGNAADTLKLLVTSERFAEPYTATAELSAAESGTGDLVLGPAEWVEPGGFEPVGADADAVGLVGVWMSTTVHGLQALN